MLVNQFDRVLVTSPVDKAALEQLANRKSEIENPKSELEVLPNGVALEYFAPSTAPRDPGTIVFTGKMSYHANITAALHLVNDIMPLVWRERPNVRVNIVGQNPPRQLQNLVTHHASRVTLTGFVPDLPPHLQHATVAVAPMSYGAGIQNKVLEAMASATPVVASPQAVSALSAVDGEHLLIGDDAESFARQVLRLLEDAELRQRIGNAGRRFVEQNHDWNHIVERFEEIYRETINRLTD
jgi:glycosyltransferase involved in cell wall biosynthesis